LPTRIIDVGDDRDTPPKLVATAGRKGIYLALSYCWGTTQQSKHLKTTRSNLCDFEGAIPFSLLPATIRDAIIATRLLHIRYLWVDTLCIIQDDDLDWKHESANMGSIFQLGLCTLAATSARHSGEGLFLLRQADNEHENHGLVEELARCEWSKRGWVVQERILSRRLVHFGSQRLFFECQEGVDTQFENGPTPFTHNLQRKPDPDRVHSAQHRFWSRVVRAYNQCDLTQPSDKLPAISGLAREMSALIRQSYFRGLWIEDIARGLFW
ncbi:HET-domain-containing protein, partial [Lophium mytilinum]